MIARVVNPPGGHIQPANRRRGNWPVTMQVYEWGHSHMHRLVQMTDNIVRFPRATPRPYGLSDDEVQKAIAFAYRLMALGLVTDVASEIDGEGHKRVVITGQRTIQICKGNGLYAAFLGGGQGMIAGASLEEVLERTDQEIAPMRQADEG